MIDAGKFVLAEDMLAEPSCKIIYKHNNVHDRLVYDDDDDEK